MLNRRFTLPVVSMTILLMWASLAVAQSDTGSTGKNRRNPDTPKHSTGGGEAGDSGLLAGPVVEQEAETARGTMMGAERPRAGAAQQNIPIRQWMETIRGLELAPEQRERVMAVFSEFQAKAAEHQRTRGPELRRLQQQVRQARENGADLDPSVRARMRELEVATPNAVDAQHRIWELLTPEQQSAARDRFAVIAQQQQQRRGAQGANPPRPGGARNNDTPTGSGSEGMTDQMLPPSGNAPGRNTRQSTRPGSDDQMPPTGGSMNETPASEPSRAAPNAPNAPVRERALARRAAAAAGINIAQLDEPARKRVRFLLSRQKSARQGDAPSTDDLRFRFDEDSGS